MVRPKNLDRDNSRYRANKTKTNLDEHKENRECRYGKENLLTNICNGNKPYRGGRNVNETLGQLTVYNKI